MASLILQSIAAHSMLFWVSACLAVIGDLRPFRVPDPSSRFAAVFVSVCFSFAILLVWGLGPALVVQAIATVSAALRHRMGVERALVLLAQFALALVAAYAVLRALGSSSFQPGDRITGTDGLALALAAATWFVVDYAIFVIWYRYRQARSWRHALTPTLGYELLSTGALLLLAILLVGAPSGWNLVLTLVPVLAVSELARLYNDHDQELRRDALSGLLSRRAMTDDIDDLATQHRSGGEPPQSPGFALVMLDLDRFRQVNVALGHAVGNRLLTAVADRLTEIVPTTNRVARLGGNEFAILLPHVRDAHSAMEFADQVGRAFAVPADIDGQPIDIDVSIGVALFPDDGHDSATLLRRAEAAVFQAKHRAGTTAVYTPGEDRSAAMRWDLLADLRDALDSGHGGLTMHYQPQVSIDTGHVVGVEALLRWHHPDRGPVGVQELLWAAEHSPVMGQLTRYVIKEVVAQLARWNSSGQRRRAAVNVSVRDLDTPGLPGHIAEALERADVHPAQLTVEITETALMGELGRAKAMVERLAGCGIGVALDDFGTGYSSMSHLRGLPVHEIKIDRSFTSRMAHDSRDSAIVRSIIDLGRDLGLRVVAEGVEDQLTYELLREAGCHIAQGWVVAPAMPGEEFVACLTERDARGEAVPALTVADLELAHLADAPLPEKTAQQPDALGC